MSAADSKAKVQESGDSSALPHNDSSRFAEATRVCTAPKKLYQKEK